MNKWVLLGVLSVATVGLTGVFAWATYEPKPCNVSNDLAWPLVQPGELNPDVPIPVAVELTKIQAMYAAVEENNDEQYHQIASSGGVMFIPGGSPAKIIGEQGDYVQVSLHGCDVMGTDVSNITGWTHKMFFQAGQPDVL